MGDQAQQSQELELWHVVSSSGNARTRQTRARRANTQTRSEMQRRGNASSYNRTRTGTVRTANARSSYPRSTGEVRAEYARPASAVRPANPRPVRPANARPARTADTRPVRPANARPARTADTRPVRTANAGMARPANSRTRAKAQSANKKKPGKRARVNQFFAFVWVVLMCAAMVFMGNAFYKSMQASPAVKADKPAETSVSEELPAAEDTERKPDIQEDFLTISEYNRPGTELACVKNIFVHYTANPKTSAAQNRSYFENLGQTHERAASAHFIIGYSGEIIQCIPLEEEAYAVVERNGDSISIECCYLAADGSFTKETYESLVEMLAWLIDKYDLEPKDILRHYDCGGKLCPIYYVKHEDAWQQLLDDVANYTF